MKLLNNIKKSKMMPTHLKGWRNTIKEYTTQDATFKTLYCTSAMLTLEIGENVQMKCHGLKSAGKEQKSTKNLSKWQTKGTMWTWIKRVIEWRQQRSILWQRSKILFDITNKRQSFVDTQEQMIFFLKNCYNAKTSLPFSFCYYFHDDFQMWKSS